MLCSSVDGLVGQIVRDDRLGVAVGAGALRPLHLGAGNLRPSFRQLREIELDDRQRQRILVAEDADVHLPPLDVLLDQHRRIEVRVQPVDALHQLADRRHDGVELDADGAVLARRLDDDRELEVVGEVEPAAIGTGEHRRMNAVELEDLLGDALVLRVEQPVRSASR